MTNSRTLIALATFGSLFIAPWWVPGLGMFALALRWRSWEVILIGLTVDILWLPYTLVSGIPVATFFGILVVWLLEPLRRQFMFDYEE